MKVLTTCIALSLAGAASAVEPWKCPKTYSAGPCFSSAKNWTEAQRTWCVVDQ